MVASFKGGVQIAKLAPDGSFGMNVTVGRRYQIQVATLDAVAGASRLHTLGTVTYQVAQGGRTPNLFPKSEGLPIALGEISKRAMSAPVTQTPDACSSVDSQSGANSNGQSGSQSGGTDGAGSSTSAGSDQTVAAEDANGDVNQQDGSQSQGGAQTQDGSQVQDDCSGGDDLESSDDPGVQEGNSQEGDQVDVGQQSGNQSGGNDGTTDGSGSEAGGTGGA
ncbi:MAG: hypothetical protein ACYCWW_02340 [Deltaproteobacteria bacterium]